MTVEELQNALLLAKASDEVEAITSMDDIDVNKLTGVALIDSNFVSFKKSNLAKFEFDFDKEELILTYKKKVKDPADQKYYVQEAYQVIPVSMITKVLIVSEKTLFVPKNVPFGIATENNDPYYLSKDALSY